MKLFDRVTQSQVIEVHEVMESLQKRIERIMKTVRGQSAINASFSRRLKRLEEFIAALKVEDMPLLNDEEDQALDVDEEEEQTTETSPMSREERRLRLNG